MITGEPASHLTDGARKQICINEKSLINRVLYNSSGL